MPAGYCVRIGADRSRPSRRRAVKIPEGSNGFGLIGEVVLKTSGSCLTMRSTESVIWKQKTLYGNRKTGCVRERET